MKFAWPILFFLLCSFSLGIKSPGNYIPGKKYSPEELKEDLSYLRNKYEHHNPNLYLYTPKAQLDKLFDSLYDAIRSPMTDMEFYRFIGPVTSRIKDGHTSVFPNEDCEWWYGNQPYFMPLLVTCNQGRIYTDLCASPDTTIPDGSEILSINNYPAQTIIDKMERYIPRDGYNATRVTWMMNNFFTYFYYYAVDTATSFRIVYRSDSGYALSHTMNGIAVDSMWQNAYKFYPKRYIAGRKDSTITLRFMDDSSVAILRIRSFVRNTKSKDESFKKIIHRAFVTIKNASVKNLVIDVRDNGGGNPEYARYVISHLLDKKYVYIEKYKTVERLHWNNEDKRTRTQWYPYCGIGTFAPEKNCYTGKLYVLMDGGSTSTAGDFVACLDYYDRATFIGEESGANRVISGGNVFSSDFELPNTKLRCRMSTIQGVNKTDVANDGHGVIPDYLVVPTPDDYMNFRNPMLEKALELIRSTGNRP